ncbi:hypothetical protein L1887_59793 [Cichorium endivia]|nr:hypothetical protein L1887_59793 [Cichorium endivia]
MDSDVESSLKSIAGVGCSTSVLGIEAMLARASCQYDTSMSYGESTEGEKEKTVVARQLGRWRDGKKKLLLPNIRLERASPERRLLARGKNVGRQQQQQQHSSQACVWLADIDPRSHAGGTRRQPPNPSAHLDRLGPPFAVVHRGR